MLKIWLPLDGDLRNLGCSDVTVTGGAINSNGKIGTCYSVNSSTKIIINHTLPITTEFTFTFWLKIPTAESSNTGWEQMFVFDNINNANNTNSSTGINWASYQNVKIYDDAQHQWLWAAPNTNFKYDTWHHWSITHTANGAGVQCKIYIDGKYINTYNNTTHPLKIRPGNIIIGNGITTDKLYINDFRLYDHCLSAAEVHEIAMGLVLHYKLDNMKIKTGTNLVTGITAGGRTTVLTDGRIGVKTTGENKDTYFSINLSESITNGTRYFLSCDASGIPNNGYWYFPLGTQNNSSLPFRIYNGHNEYSFVANDISWGENRLFMDDNNRQYWDGQASFWNFELYKEPSLEIEDSSGYGHNAILTNSLLTTDTPRYLETLILDSSTKAIGTPIFESGVFIPEYTWTGWIKRNYTTASAKQIHANIANINLYTDFTPYLSWTSGKVDGSTTGNGAAGGSKIATLNEWIHMAITYKSGIGKFYINGELIRTWDYTSQGVYIVAAENNTLGNGFIGNLSDIRIYTTQLLDNDIKMLYNVGMRVDNLGEIHSFEFKEAGGRELLGGVPLTTSYSNHENIYTNYANGEIKLTGNSSISTPYIEISPTGKTYYWDAIITKDASNVFYLGFERYDANKTARSNNATTYVIGEESTAWTKKHVFGTVNLSTDGVNACKYITLRILNDWSSANNRTAIIHQLSLREISTAQKQSLNKNGILLLDELKEDSKAAFYKNGFIESTEFIEI